MFSLVTLQDILGKQINKNVTMEKGMIWYNSGNTMEINKASFYSTVALYLLSKL